MNIDPEIASVVAEIVGLGAGIAGIYLTVGLVLAMVQAEIGVATGAPQALAQAWEQVLLIAFCFAVAITAQSLGDEVAGMLKSGAGGSGEAITLWTGLAQLVVDIVVFSTGAGMTLFVATGASAAQLASLLGQPNAHATAISRVGLALACGVLTLLAVAIANAIVSAALGGSNLNPSL